MSKAVIFVLLLQVLAIYGAGRVMIKNKKTGMVLDGKNQVVTIEPYDGSQSQLWTTKAGAAGSTIFKNVANGKVLDACPATKIILTWPQHGSKNQQWNLKSNARFTVNHYPNHVLVHRNNKLFLDSSTHNDYSDEWLLVAPEDV